MLTENDPQGSASYPHSGQDKCQHIPDTVIAPSYAKLRKQYMKQRDEIELAKKALWESKREKVLLEQRLSSFEIGEDSLGLLNRGELLARRRSMNALCGVYFLFKRDELIYVGQSENVYIRLGFHADKEFDSFAFIECGLAELDRLESLYILKYKPKLNAILGPSLHARREWANVHND